MPKPFTGRSHYLTSDLIRSISCLISELANLLGINRIRSTPQANERWTEALLSVLLGIRTAIKNDLNCFEAEIVFRVPQNCLINFYLLLKTTNGQTSRPMPSEQDTTEEITNLLKALLSLDGNYSGEQEKMDPFGSAWLRSGPLMVAISIDRLKLPREWILRKQNRRETLTKWRPTSQDSITFRTDKSKLQLRLLEFTSECNKIENLKKDTCLIQNGSQAN
ncbi:hypothetical protein ACTXT7_008284 [Hymenolepis weldensis]